jgi:large subunit ribosomal protein L16
MLLQPKKLKFKKLKKNYLKNCLETKSFELRQGTVGLKALSSMRITSRQIEAVRQCINRDLGRSGKIWINVFPQIPVTKKPTENRMGKGKGSISFWCVPIKTGTLLFEIAGVSNMMAKRALVKGGNKLPFKTKIIIRN